MRIHCILFSLNLTICRKYRLFPHFGITLSLSVQEIFDPLSVGIVFYTLGIIGDICTIITLCDSTLISLGNNLTAILEDSHMFAKYAYILGDIMKNNTLILIAMCSTLMFRIFSFTTGLEATFYPLDYTINVLIVFLMQRSNVETYNRCCGSKMERRCFAMSFGITSCFCRFQYGNQWTSRAIMDRLDAVREEQSQERAQEFAELEHL